MIISITLITIGIMAAEKVATDKEKFKKISALGC